MYLTISEQETRAYMAGDVQLANALALVDDAQLWADNLYKQVGELELKIDDLEWIISRGKE